MQDKRKPKTVKTKPEKPKSNQKKTTVVKKNSKQLDSITGLMLVFIGIFLSLALTTDSMGFVGSFLRDAMNMMFSGLSIVLTLSFLVIGAVQLIYTSRFSISKTPKLVFVLFYFLLICFYATIHANTALKNDFSINILTRIVEDSKVGLNIGLFPYLLSYGLFHTIGRIGMILLCIALTLFLLIYQFRLQPKDIAPFLKKSVFSFGRSFGSLKNYITNFVMQDVDDTAELYHSEALPAEIDSESIESKGREDGEAIGAPKSPFHFFASIKDKLILDKGPTDPVEGNDIEDSDADLVYEEGMIDPETNDTAVSENASYIKSPLPSYEEYFEPSAVPKDPYENRETVEESIVQEKAAYSGGNHDKTIRLDGNSILEAMNVNSAGVFSKDPPLAVHAEAPASVSYSDVDGERKVIQTSSASEYILPPLWLLKNTKAKPKNTGETRENATVLRNTLKVFGVDAEIKNISVGPRITRYEIQPAIGTKVSKIVSLSDDLSLALASNSIRIEAPIPGKSLVGIEVSNKTSEIVSFRSVIDSPVLKKNRSPIAFPLGKDVAGEIVIADISDMPHVLVAGSTGSGKSICINGMICSILMRATPEEVRFILIDPKIIELSVYNQIPHLLIPVITDMKKAPYALNWAVNEMNRRYEVFSENRVKDLNSYNALPGVKKMERIVIVIDELADLMMVSPKEVEDAIIRIAQKARACGMHLIIATQRPSVDVITGLIKANIPSRIAFAVSSQTDSRTILDGSGAEKLLGKGDMLYQPITSNKAVRLQSPYLSDKEINNIVNFIISQNYRMDSDQNVLQQVKEAKREEESKEDSDPIYPEVVEFAVSQGQISTSLIQRKFRIGFNRASRIVDELEENGIIGPKNGVKPREVIKDK